MKKLIECEYLKEGQQLYNKKGEKICFVCKDGCVFDGEDILSIHKMSAKHLGLKNNNGWDYFYISNNGVDTLDSLRYKYISKERENG